jgi:phage head maturation protease
MLREDAKGLRIIARVNYGVPIAEGAGLSFGYRVRTARHQRAVRELLDLDLVEVSVVTSPMQPLARVHRTEPDLAERDTIVARATATDRETNRAKTSDEHRPS